MNPSPGRSPILLYEGTAVNRFVVYVFQEIRSWVMSQPGRREKGLMEKGYSRCEIR